MGILALPETLDRGAVPVMAGARCNECGNMTVIRKHDCDSFTACAWTGGCG
jgi:ribonucleoside-diphosphate reductase alpha chain